MALQTEVNLYPDDWFEVFGAGVPAAQTVLECDWIERRLKEPIAHILDVGCGMGRHSNELARRGHSVLGIDRSSSAIQEARSHDSGAEFLCADLGSPPPIHAQWNAVICMWQSFGFGSESDNQQWLTWFANRLRSDGIVILDIYDPDFFTAERLLPRTFTRAGMTGTELKTRTGDRLAIELQFDSANVDTQRFEWMLYSRSRLADLGTSAGLTLDSSWRNFEPDSGTPGSSPRVQHVLRREGPSHA